MGKYDDAMSDWKEQDRISIYKFETPGDAIYGTLRRIAYEKGQFGEQLAMNIESDEGVRKVFCPTVLRRRVEDNWPSVGMDVACKFFGTGEGKRGQFKDIGFQILDENGVPRDSVRPAVEAEEATGNDDDDIPF